MTNGEYQDAIDEAEDQYEIASDLPDAQLDSYDGGTFPTAKEKSDIWNWFWKVVQLGYPEFGGDESLSQEALKLSKVGNLNGEEIGKHSISVRDSLVLANLGETFHHKKFGNFWRQVGMVTVATSMSKKGWLVEQSISQKKIRQRERSSSLTPEKWRLFGKKKENKEE
jgi:hypothetical protein